MEAEKLRENRRFFIEIATAGSHWFALFLAVAYATGFLCAFTFLDRFGIRESSGDILRVKYIHVGILFLLFPVSVLGPLWVIISLRRADKKRKVEDLKKMEQQKISLEQGATTSASLASSSNEKSDGSIYIVAMLSYLNLCFVFYIFILFAPRDILMHKEKQLAILAIFLFGVLLPFLTEDFVKRWIVSHKNTSFLLRVRWAILIFSIPLDVWAFWGLWGALGRIVWGQGLVPDGAFYYVIFLALIPYVLWRANVRGRRAATKKAKQEIQLSAVALCLMFYFLAIIAFALKVYPFIPSAKGGADLTEASIARFEIKAEFESSAGKIIDDVLILEQTPSSFYVANRYDNGGPRVWRGMRKLPGIIEIPRDAVKCVIIGKK